MIGDHDFGAGLEIERGEHGVHARGGVGDEGQIFSGRAEEGGEDGARVIKQAFEFAHEEVQRVVFQPLAELELLRLHDPRAGAECAVVQVDHVWVEAEVAGERAARSGRHAVTRG